MLVEAYTNVKQDDGWAFGDTYVLTLMRGWDGFHLIGQAPDRRHGRHWRVSRGSLRRARGRPRVTEPRALP